MQPLPHRLVLRCQVSEGTCLLDHRELLQAHHSTHSAPSPPLRPAQAYWPFHKTQCRRNEFADMIEESEPKFARWMRSHGKLAVLKDDEVERLERAAAAASGPSRQDVMDSMYGRLEPKPQESSYSAEERRAMRLKEDEEAAAARRLAPPSYLAIDIPRDLGLDCGTYRWRQNQSHVEIFVPLPEGLSTANVAVTLSTTRMCVELDERPALKGQLYREIKADESTWYVQDRVLEIVLLKRCRRGHYGDRATNADTFWRAVLAAEPKGETLALEHPPTSYYWAPCEDGGDEKRAATRRLPPARNQQQKALPEA